MIRTRRTARGSAPTSLTKSWVWWATLKTFELRDAPYPLIYFNMFQQSRLLDHFELRTAVAPESIAGTVGGGTSFGTARECLETLGCYGNGKSKRFAEIIAATAMAGEISLMISIVNGTYIYAHETFGRNRPPQ